MVRIEDLILFDRTVALGSFSNAAREADLLPGQVSAAIKRLERELDVRLFARSTRSMRLTAEGERYLPHAREAISAVNAGHDRLHGASDRLSGTLQIAAPSDLGRNVLLPWITEFRAANPDLSLRLFLSDVIADVFRDPVDIAIRYGDPADASYVALPLAADNRRVLVASPDYLDRHGRPDSIADLRDHQCLLFVIGGKPDNLWRFPRGQREDRVQVSGGFLCDDAEIATRWAIAGQGITYKSWLDVCAEIRAGRLEVVLPERIGQPYPINFICPHRKQFQPAIRQLHEHLVRRCAEHA